MIWLNLKEKEKKAILQELEQSLNLTPIAIEKDWWVTAVLCALFKTPFANSLTFKGGTSLSKGWNIIKRFSEDIDIAINREFLGFGGNLTKTQISDKLRRASCTFVREKMPYEIEKQLQELGINKKKFNIHVNITSVSTTDPEIIEIEYNSLLPVPEYIKPRVLIEVSARSMSEPYLIRNIQSLIGEAYSNYPFADTPFAVPIVAPERTFLEKVFLLHEEFAKPSDQIRFTRMSRHLYDIEKLSDTQFAAKAIADTQLYKTIIQHRQKFIGLRDFDYTTLLPATINFCPPSHIQAKYKEDYQIMQSNLIYEDSLPYSVLIERLQKLNQQFRKIPLSTID